jgi:hypothetical protein
MTYNLFHTPTYHFDSSQPGGQDAILYYHREFSTEELDKVRDLLYTLLRQKNRKATVQFFLTLAEFPEAMESLKVQIDQWFDHTKHGHSDEHAAT